jgi:hypothetical protein
MSCVHDPASNSRGTVERAAERRIFGRGRARAADEMRMFALWL